MAWLLDTNVISEGRKRKPDARVAAFYRTQRQSDLFISVVNMAELRFGIEQQEDVARRTALSEWLRGSVRPAFAGRILPITEDIVVRWRLLTEGGRKVGYTYSNPDLLLAATALEHGLTVVTRDRSDFDRAQVPVFNPWEQ